MDNAVETSSYIVEMKGIKSILVKRQKRNAHALSLAVLTDGIKLWPYVFLIHKTMPKEHLLTGIVVKCQTQDEYLQIQ